MIKDGSIVEADDIKEDIQLADLITLTIGGNDTVYLPFKIPGKTEEEIQKITVSNNDPLVVIVGGKELQTTPLLFNGRSFLPIRESAETLGAYVSWHGLTKTATVTYNGNSVQFSIEDNSEDLYFHESKIYISLRSVAESLGFNVKYISKSNTAYINR